VKLTYEDFARACREGDDAADKGGAVYAMDEAGIELVGAIDAAKQRAIRIALFTAGKPIPTTTEIVDVSPMPQEEFRRLQAAVLDGISIGVRAALNAAQQLVDEAMRRSQQDL
jgi:hypothetical protein